MMAWAQNARRKITFGQIMILAVCSGCGKMSATGGRLTPGALSGTNSQASTSAVPTFSANTRDPIQEASGMAVSQIYRIYNPTVSDHLYSSDPSEGDTIGYLAEGQVFQTVTANVAGATALLRCRFGNQHFLSASPTCEGQVIDASLGYLFVSAFPGTAPLYRFSSSSGDHLETLSLAEGTAAGFTYEGVLGYVFPPAAQGSLPPIAGINWLAPLEPVAGFPGAADFMNLFQPGAGWQGAMSHINGIILYDYYIYAASDAELSQIFSFISAHAMLLAITLDPISPPAACPTMVGSIASSGTLPGVGLAAKIKRLGGNLNYVILDEPFYWGHFSGQTGAGGASCMLSVNDLAANIVPQIQGVKAVFPNIRIGEEEPLENYPVGDQWITDYSQWLSDLAAAGTPVAVYHDDATPARATWNSRIRSLQTVLENEGVAYGFIHNGTGAVNDSRWMANFQARIQTYNWAGLAVPAQHAFQTWDPYPSTNLQETAPESLTGLVNYYFDSPYTQAPPPIALARLTAPNQNAWLLTTNESEMNSAESMGWNSLEVVAYIYPSPTSSGNLVTIERLFYPPTNDFLFTCSQAEAASAAALGYVDQGPAGYAFLPTDPRGTLLYNANNGGQHYYTTSSSEMAAFLASHPQASQEAPRCATIPYVSEGQTW